MEVKEIIKNTANILNLKSIIDYLDSDNNQEVSVEVLQDISNIVLAVNMTNNNIASNYLELIDVVEIKNYKKILPYSEITNKDIIEIKKVMDLNGNELDYKVMPNGVMTECDNIKIEFSYFPEIVGIEDSINYYTKVNALTFALGVAGEYLFLKGAIDDAYMWDKRFKSNLFNVLRPRRNVKIPARRWV